MTRMPTINEGDELAYGNGMHGRRLTGPIGEPPVGIMKKWLMRLVYLLVYIVQLFVVWHGLNRILPGASYVASVNPLIFMLSQIILMGVLVDRYYNDELDL